MNYLIGKWIGNTYGTHTANVFAEFTIQNEFILAIIRMAYIGKPEEVRILTGVSKNKDGEISFDVSEKVNNEINNVTGVVVVKNMQEFSCELEYEISTGSKGVIKLSRTPESNVQKLDPPQIIARDIPLDYHFKIYRKDIFKIIDIMRELATQPGSVIIAETRNGAKTINYADNYIKLDNHADIIDSLSLTAQAPSSGFTNTITLNLNRTGRSSLISQSADIMWSQGSSVILKEYLDNRTNKLLNFYKKYGLDMHFILFLFLISILPSFDIELRIVIVIGFLIAIFVHRAGYNNLSQTVIKINTEEPGGFREKYPKISYVILTIVSGSLGIIGSLVASKVIAYCQKILGL